MDTNPPPWDKVIYARRHHIENLFSRLKDAARIALLREDAPQLDGLRLHGRRHNQPAPR